MHFAKLKTLQTWNSSFDLVAVFAISLSTVSLVLPSNQTSEKEKGWKESIYFPVGKTTKKKSLKEYIFINSTLKIQCYIVKNTLLFGDFAHWVRG